MAQLPMAWDGNGAAMSWAAHGLSWPRGGHGIVLQWGGYLPVWRCAWLAIEQPCGGLAMGLLRAALATDQQELGSPWAGRDLG